MRHVSLVYQNDEGEVISISGMLDDDRISELIQEFEES